MKITDIIVESGPFSYGTKKPRKGSVADLADKKRREQEKGKQPIEPRNQQVGVAKVTKGVTEGDDRGDYHATARAAEQATRTAKTPQDHTRAADLHNRAATYALSAGKDESDIRDHQMMARHHHKAAKGLAEGKPDQLPTQGADYSQYDTDHLKTLLKPGILHRNEARFKALIRKELQKRQQQGVAEGLTPASTSKVLRLIQRHRSDWFDTYGIGEVEDTVVDMAEMGQFQGMSAEDAVNLVGQELESMYGQQGVAEGYDKWGWHTSLTNGEFMPTKYGDKAYVYLHDLDNESPRGGPQLVTVNKPAVAKRLAKQFGGKVVKTDLNTYRIVQSAEQGVAESTEQSLEKKIQAKRDSLSLAREQRRMRGQHQQGQREIKLQAEIDRLSTELTQLKQKSVTEGFTGRETKDGTWRVFKDGQSVAVAGPFKSKEDAAAWIKKQKQSVSEDASAGGVSSGGFAAVPSQIGSMVKRSSIYPATPKRKPKPKNKPKS